MIRLAALLLCAGTLAAAPRLVVLGTASPEVQAEAAARGWEIASQPEGPSYLIGSTPDVLFAVSRTPAAWIAAVGTGGDRRRAIDTNRIFTANLTLVPILESKPGLTVKQAFDWLAEHKHEPWPQKVDCETGDIQYARCYWAEIAKLDPAQRNDVLPTTRVNPGSGAALALGAYSYDPSAPGPGVLVTAAAKGPLKPQDRIVALAGKPIDDAEHFRDLLEQIKDERPIAVIVQRGKDRLRLETRTVLAKREETVTGRIQAEYLPDSHELMVITRGVGAFRLNVPEHWTPARITWNGDEEGEASAPGCWSLGTTEKTTRCAP